MRSSNVGMGKGCFLPSALTRSSSKGVSTSIRNPVAFARTSDRRIACSIPNEDGITPDQPDPAPDRSSSSPSGST